MSKEAAVIALGIFVAVVPQLGIPAEWKAAALLICGVAVAIIGFLLRGEALAHGTRRHEHNAFVDSFPQDASTGNRHGPQEGITPFN